MQAHPLSTTAARISPLSQSLLAPRSAAKLPQSLLISGPRAAPHHGRPLTRPLNPLQPVAEGAGLAHDASNLLGALQLYTELLSMPGVLAAEHRHLATDLHLVAARSSALMRRLLLLSTSAAEVTPRVQPDASASEPLEASEPAAVLRALGPVLQRIAAGAAHVTVSAPTGLPAIDLPSEALERIAVNLVRNAAEAIRSARDTTAAPGRIRVALEASAGHLRLLVEDDGPGMPPTVAAAFLNPTPMPTGATRGLGHRIVHQLANSTGATLSVRVRPGRGTTFCLRWPLAEGAANAADSFEPGFYTGPPPNLHAGALSC